MQATVCILALSAAYAQGRQDVEIGGTVTDSLEGTPLSNVYVCVYSQGRALAYSFTDNDGRFRIVVNSGQTPDILTLSMMGYAFKSCALDGNTGNVAVRLSRKHVELGQVTVTAPAITRENDTVNYYMEAFRDESDVSLKQVLLKFPGIDVAKNGTIYHKGKAINKFYIEGMDLLGNRYAVVTENLDPRRIAKVQIIENHQPVKALQGLAVSDRSAVNIVLKSDAKGAWLFSADAAGGYMEDSTALVKGRLWFANFSKNHQSLIMMKGNNTGEAVTEELRKLDYWGRQGVIINSGGSIETDFEGPFGIRRVVNGLPDEYYFNNMSAILSANHIRAGKGGTQMRFSLQGAAERWQEKEAESQTIRFNDGSLFSISETDSRDDRSLYLDAGLNIESNTEKTYLTDDLSVSGQLRGHISALQADVSHRQQYSLPSLKVENRLVSTVRVTPERALDVKSDLKAVFNNHSLLLDGTMSQNIRYADVTAVNSISAVFRVRRLVFDVRGNIDIGYYRRYSEIDNISSDMEYALQGNVRNSLGVFSISPLAEASLAWSKGPFSMRLKVPAGCEYMRVWNTGMGGVRNMFLPDVSPSMTIEWIIVADLKAALDGSWSLSSGDADDMVTGYILRDYRSAFRSEVMPQLENYRAGISFSYSSVLSEFGASVRAGISGSSASTSLSAMYFDNLTLMETTHSPSSRQSAYGALTLRKWFGPKAFSMTVNMQYRQDRMSMFLQDEYADRCSETLTAGTQIESSVADWLDLTASFTYSRSRLMDRGTGSVHSFQTEGKIVITPVKPFSLSGSVFHLYQKIPGTSVTNVPLLRVGAEYRFSKFRIFVECVNLLNATELRRESIDAYSSWWNSFAMRPRSYLAGISMSF